MENNFAVTVFINKEGKVESVDPQSDWEGQLDWEIITYLEDRNPGGFSKGGCKVDSCPYGPDLHRHKVGATAHIFFSANGGDQDGT